MTKRPKSAPPPPPYFNLDPERAAARLGPPVDTAQFAKAAAFAAKGREDLARKGYAPDGRKRLRKFSTWEVCRYLLPVAPSHFRRVLRQNPTCPRARASTAPSGSPSRRSCALRNHLADEGLATKQYRPWRPAGLPAKVTAVANFKGGVGKTSTAAHLAMSAALDGYRVLVIDLDSQGSMTSIFGGQVARRVDDRLPPDRQGLRPPPRRREPRPGGARSAPPAPRRHPVRGPQPQCGRGDPEDPLAEHRPHRRPAQPLLGRVPDPGLAHAGPRLAALGRPRRTSSPPRASSTPTTSSSSTPRRPSAT